MAIAHFKTDETKVTPPPPKNKQINNNPKNKQTKKTPVSLVVIVKWSSVVICIHTHAHSHTHILHRVSEYSMKSILFHTLHKWSP